MSPTFTDTTAVATASAIRPSTSDRIRPAPASREAMYAVTPISVASRNPDTSNAGPRARKKKGTVTTKATAAAVASCAQTARRIPDQIAHPRTGGRQG